MKLNQIGITILAVGTIIVSGCAADGSYTAAIDNSTVDSPLIEFGDTDKHSIRPTVDSQTASKAFVATFNAKSQRPTNRWTAACSNRCRYEASEARKRCIEEDLGHCDKEAQDVFDTCTAYECTTDGQSGHSAFDDKEMPADETQSVEEELVDPLLACQEACGEFGTKTYLRCLDDTQYEDPIRCRNMADATTTMCIRSHCPSEEI